MLHFQKQLYFFEDFDLASCPDDSALYSVVKSAEFSVNNSAEQILSICFEWFNNNYMKANADKDHLSVSENLRVTTKIHDNSEIHVL